MCTPSISDIAISIIKSTKILHIENGKKIKVRFPQFYQLVVGINILSLKFPNSL